MLGQNVNPATEPPMLLVGLHFPSAPGKPKKTSGYFLSLSVVSRGAVVYDSRYNQQDLPCVVSGAPFSFEIPMVTVRGDTKLEVYKHKSDSPSSDRVGKKKYNSDNVWPFCQVPNPLSLRDRCTWCGADTAHGAARWCFTRISTGRR